MGASIPVPNFARGPMARPEEAALAALVGLVVGGAMGVGIQVALGLIALIFAIYALSAPTAAWAAAAITVAVAGRLTTLAGAPEMIALGAIPLAWIALGLAILRSENRPSGRWIFGLLAALVVVIATSTLADRSEPARAALSLGLLVSPLALVAALVLDPPSERWRSRLLRVLILLAVAQIPMALLQVTRFGIGDLVEGTFIGSEVGAHMAASVTLLGAVWLVLSGLTMSRALIVGLLVTVPMMAAANQVIFALPIALILVAAIGNRRLAIAGVLGVGLLGTLLLAPGWNSDYARSSLNRATFALKLSSLEAIGKEIEASPSVALIGRGPGRTVSHASYLSTEPGSPLETIGIGPSEIPDSFGLRDIDEAVSVIRPESSLLGVFGDFGAVGLLLYLGLVFLIANRCRQRGTPEGLVAAVGLFMLLILGYISDWLEQPGITLFVAALAGLALSDHQRKPAAPAPR